MKTAETLGFYAPSHGRGHRFNPCRTHHFINGLATVVGLIPFSLSSLKSLFVPQKWYKIGTVSRARFYCAPPALILSVFLWVSAELHAPADLPPPKVVCDNVAFAKLTNGRRAYGAFDGRTWSVVFPEYDYGPAWGRLLAHEFTHYILEGRAREMEVLYAATHEGEL